MKIIIKQKMSISSILGSDESRTGISTILKRNHILLPF